MSATAATLGDGVARLLGPDGVAREVPTDLAPDALVELHRAMVEQRAVDTALSALEGTAVLRRYPPATGLEAAIFGPGWALNAQDWVFPAMREHGIARLRGATLDEVVAQAFGNLLDKGRGRQLPGYVAAPAQQLASPSPPLATQLVHAVGAARGMKLAKSNAVAVAYLGAAATCTSDFHTACHVAGRERLPVVFVCIRNMNAANALPERTRAETVADRVRPYGIAATRVDGADVLACYAATRDAVARARQGDGPGFIEALAWRLEDPSAAATASGWDAWDPIRRLEAWGLAAGWLDRDQLAEARGQARTEIEDVVAIMRVQDPPAEASVFDDVLAERPWSLEAQLAELQGG
ncbi:MAG: thiamine pyrophosphate-dependent dehydrogenase E1 component subunit alpha [Deltaproteobacteria bacterium]|nr:MAG: thiamine pyrophosphate-dependent dehydrogenase E1 component subunit alpha [Deltaproteobacteria bacterium]